MGLTAVQNVEDDYSISDAPLTALGKDQASRLPSLTQALQAEVEVVITSPLRRTLQSTKLGYGPAIERLGGLGSVVCLPQLQGVYSRSTCPCSPRRMQRPAMRHRLVPRCARGGPPVRGLRLLAALA